MNRDIPYTKKEIGDRGEFYCVQYLLKNGYEILHRNYRKSFGEIDIIARRDGVVSFVEVKTRHHHPMTQPWEAVGYRKQQHIIQTAQAYLIEYDVHAFCRFDVCEVIVDSETLNLLHLHYIKSAFECR